jgi:Terminase small subunit
MTEPTNPEAVPAWAKKLSDQERLFVLEYTVDLNATQAALRAGYGKGDTDAARKYASELRRKHHIGEAIAALMSERYGATQSRVIEELAKLALILRRYGRNDPRSAGDRRRPDRRRHRRAVEDVGHRNHARVAP